jgi:translation initiation factor IF-3
MGFTKYTTQNEKTAVRMNESIRAPEIRVLGPEGENFGILATSDALAKAARWATTSSKSPPTPIRPSAK